LLVLVGDLPGPDQEIVLEETPSELERQIGVARRAVADVYLKGHREVQGFVSKWIGAEQAVERASLLPCLSCVVNSYKFATSRPSEKHHRPGRTSHTWFTLRRRFGPHWVDPRAKQVNIYAIRPSSWSQAANRLYASHNVDNIHNPKLPQSSASSSDFITFISTPHSPDRGWRFRVSVNSSVMLSSTRRRSS